MRPRGAAPAVAATLAAALLALAPGPAATREGPNLARFDWSMPSRLGHRVPGERILDYPQSAAQVPGGPFVVDFDLAAPACAGGVTRAFAVRGRAVEAQRLPGPCSFRLSFEREGTYDVGVHVKGGGRDDSYSHDVVVQDFLIVAIGDSVASGEGNPDNRSPGHTE